MGHTRIYKNTVGKDNISLPKTAPTFSDNRASTSFQLKQQQMISNAGFSNSIIQRVEKWWPTNPEHTQVTGDETSTAPQGGEYVKREKAGASDQLYSSHDDAWAKAKSECLTKRSHNTDLFPGTSERMGTEDGDRTYLGKDGVKKDVSIVVSHTNDPQSNLIAEDGTKIRVTHTHSAFAKFAAVKSAISNKEVPDYSNSPEAKIHYLSLTRQG